MSEYDKELQSNTDEFEKAIEPLDRETRKRDEREERDEQKDEG